MYQAEDYWEKALLLKQGWKNLNNKRSVFFYRNTLSTSKLIIKNHYRRKAKRPSFCTERWTQHWIRQWTIQKISIYLAQTVFLKVMKRISAVKDKSSPIPVTVFHLERNQDYLLCILSINIWMTLFYSGEMILFLRLYLENFRLIL